MSHMFFGCSSLLSVNLSLFNTEEVTDMSFMFYDCNSLTSLDISNFNMINCDLYSNMFSNISSIRYINLSNFKNDKIVSLVFLRAKDIVVCQNEKIIRSRMALYCCDYNFETQECETTIISSMPSLLPDKSSLLMSESQDFYSSTQDINDIIFTNDTETYSKDSIGTSKVLEESEIISETNEIIDTAEYFTEYNILSTTIKTTSIVEEYSSNKENKENTDFISSTNENNNEYSTSFNDDINEKTNTIYSKEPNSSIVAERETTTSRMETEKPSTFKVETEKPSTFKVETKKPKLDTKEPINSMVDTQETTTSKFDTKEPTTSKEDTKEQIEIKSDTKESISSKIENTENPSTQNEYNTKNTSSPDVKKTEYISPKTSFIDNKEQITNIPSTNKIEQSTNSQTNENNIEKTTKPSIIENTSIVINTEKTYTQTPVKENTFKVVSTSSLPEQITNKPSIYKEPEPTTTPSNQEDIKHTTTSSPEEKIPTTNQNNKEVVHTSIPSYLNLTFLSTNLVENPKSTIIEKITPKTEEITSLEKTLVILLGLSHVKLGEQLITFFIYFCLYEIFAGSKRVKFPVEITSNRVLRLLETQEAECELFEPDSKGDMYIYSCEVQVKSSQNIKNIKVYNQFVFSSKNTSISASYSTLLGQYLDNIQELGNKFDNLINSTLYTLEYPKISQGEKQIFNISGIINNPKPKFGKVDLNLSVSVEYENKTEEKQLECNIIDITENNYTLSCIGIKNTYFSLENAMSVIEDEILIIHFDENDNNTILYFSDENKNTYSRRFILSKSGNIGAGGIVAIILACVAAITALILTYFYFKKENKGNSEGTESTVLHLNH